MTAHICSECGTPVTDLGAADCVLCDERVTRSCNLCGIDFHIESDDEHSCSDCSEFNKRCRANRDRMNAYESAMNDRVKSWKEEGRP